MIKNLLLLFIVLSIIINSNAQKDWTSKFNGYVLKKDNSIESGYLKFNGTDSKKGLKIELYKKPNERPLIFYAFDLKGYAFNKDTFKILENLKVFEDKKKQFDYVEAKIETSGLLTLFSIPIVSINSGPSGGYGQTGFGSSQVYANGETIYVIESKGGIMTGVTRANFKEVMSELMATNKSLVARIEKKKLKYKDLKKIIYEYNITGLTQQ